MLHESILVLGMGFTMCIINMINMKEKPKDRINS